MHEDTYVVIPVYNEAKMVGKVIRAAKKHFKHVVCVEDGSHDDSAAVIVREGATLVQHPINLGAGAATQTGVDFALLDPKCKYVITVDADGQHDIKDAVRMLDHIKKEQVDIVMGSRFLGQVRNISKFKRLFLGAAALYSGRASGVKLTDPHIGLRVFNRHFAENLKLTLPDFAHASELVSRIKEGKFSYRELPVTVTYTDYSKAKGQPMLNAINITFDVFLSRFTK